MTEKLYRYVDGLTDYDGRYRLPKCVEFHVIKETPKGYWFKEIMWLVGYSGDKRWTSKTALRRYAHDNKEEALQAYIYRKEKQLAILEARTNKTNIMLNAARIMLRGEEPKTSYYGLLE